MTKTELTKLIESVVRKQLKSKHSLNEGFRFELIKLGTTGSGAYDSSDKTLETFEFDTKPEAIAKIKELMKKYKMKNRSGHITNYDLEIHKLF